VENKTDSGKHKKLGPVVENMRGKICLVENKIDSGK